MEEHKAQKDNRFLKGRKIANMICDNVSGTREALLDFNDLRRGQLKNDNVQGFDTQWDEVLLSTIKVPGEDIMDNMYKNISSTQRT